MLNLILILLGLISNPNTSNASNSGNDQSTTTASTQSIPGDTGGDYGQTPPRKYKLIVKEISFTIFLIFIEI